MARKNRKRRRTDKSSSQKHPIAANPQATPASEHCSVEIDIDPRYESSEADSTVEIEVDATEATGQGAAATVDPSAAVVLEYLREEFASFRRFITTEALEKKSVDGDQASFKAQCEQLREQVSSLDAQRLELEELVSQLQQQNSDLASQTAGSCVDQTIASRYSSGAKALSWDERKELILRQMEDDSFDAETFIATLNPVHPIQSESPSEYVQQLHESLQTCQSEIARRDKEVEELRCRLDQQSETIQGGVAVGAAAVAEVVDADELIRQERERLTVLQNEWAEKFREEEIAASLERAKLARERQQLAAKQADLEEQLAHVQRESLHHCQTGKRGSRRWLEKLGLSDA